MNVDKSFKHYSNKSINRHIFSRFRNHILWGATFVYLCFGVFDYLYSPENFSKWMSIRLAWVGLIFILFQLTYRYKKIRQSMQYVAGIALISACWSIVYMIFESGGSLSLYTTGLILCGTTGLQVFRLRRALALLTLSLAFFPAIIVYFYNPADASLSSMIIQSGFVIGMILLSYIYGSSEEMYDAQWQKFKVLTKEELHRLNKTEILKNHFPKMIRQQFENSPSTIFQKKELKNAVVGFADIVASTKIANEVSLEIDWELKERFLEAATTRAMASGMVVLTHLGDGFLFLANYDENTNWNYNLISFYESLIRDFKQISKDLNIDASETKTGVKFGVSSGPVMVGFLGKNQSYFTAIGPDVNLASRLCSIANTDEIVVTNTVWDRLKNILVDWNINSEINYNIKGFEYKIEAIHISPPGLHENALLCQCCHLPMILVKTEDGFLDYQCPSGPKETANVNST